MRCKKAFLYLSYTLVLKFANLQWTFYDNFETCNSQYNSTFQFKSTTHQVTIFSSLKVCMVNKYILNFVVTAHNFIIAKLSIRKPRLSSVLLNNISANNITTLLTFWIALLCLPFWIAPLCLPFTFTLNL